jgi:hypothetical protein
MITYILDGQISNPYNREDIRYRIDYSERRRINEFEITIDNLIFVREDKQRIFQHLNTFGRYQGMPLDVVFSNGQVLRYYIDFTDQATRWTENEINVKIKRYRSTDNFFDNADSLSWRLVNFQPSDFSFTDYVIIPEQQPLYFISLSLAYFSLLRELAEAVKGVQEGIADLAATLPPLPANVGAVVAAAIKLAARIAYTIFVITALIQLTTQIIEFILPKVRQLKDIKYKRLIEKGCQHLGYTLQSTALDQLNRLHFLGAPLRSFDGGIFREIFMPLSFAYTDGFPNEMDAIPTLGSAIKRLEDLFNLRTLVIDGVVRIEREDYWNNPVPNPIPLAYNLQESHEMERSFNDDFWKRKLLVWTKDQQDVFTFDDTIGHIVEVDTSVQVSPDPEIQLVKGFERIENPFSLGSRKTEFTFVEKFLKNILAPAVDLFTNGALSSAINNRIGVLTVSSQYYTNNKLLWKAGTKLHPQHRQVLSAKNIYQTWHLSENVPERTKELLENIPIRMSEETFLTLSQQKLVTLTSGKQLELLNLEWSEHEAEASATFELDSDYGVNLQTTIINGGGI